MSDVLEFQQFGYHGRMLSRSLSSSTRKRCFDGTHRTLRPDVTLNRIAPYFPDVGITRLADVTGLDCIGIPVCNAIRPNARSLSVSQGKGISLDHARVSAAMEAIELFHAERFESETVRASYRRLGRNRAVDPSWLAVLPGRFRGLAGTDLRWVQGSDLIGGGQVWVPYDAVACDLGMDAPSDGVFLTSSNGLGSGNHHIEAILHGLCEVVERDATCLHQAAGRRFGAEPALIDLDTVDDPLCRRLLERIEAAGIAVFVWRQFSDLAVPSFGCAISDDYGGTMPGAPIGTFQGYGCHLDRGVALARAVTEAVQARLTYISGARDDLFRDDYALIQSRRNRHGWHSWLVRSRPTLHYHGAETLASDDIATDLDRLLATLERAGFRRVVAVDLSIDGIGIPVTRVVVPGMIEPGIDGSAPAGERINRFLTQEAASEKLLRDGLRTGTWACAKS